MVMPQNIQQTQQPQQTQPQQTQPQQTEPQLQQPQQQQLLNTLFSQVSQQECQQMGVGRQIYSIFHSLMAIVAIYMSYRCNNGFHLGSFLIACTCPYIYVIYMVATRGTCGILENESGSKSGSKSGSGSSSDSKSSSK